MEEGTNSIIEIPFGFTGKIFSSSMPFSSFDPYQQVWLKYQEANIKCAFVLAEKNEILVHAGRDLLVFYKSKGVDVIHFPIPDFKIPNDHNDFYRMLDQVGQKASAGTNLVIHCLAGKGRTGLVLASLARKYLGLDGKRAIHWVRNYLPGAIENIEQERFVCSE